MSPSRQEAAPARLLTLGDRRAELFPFGLGAVVEHDRSDRLVERDVEVVVEVAAVGGVPRERPPLARFVVLDLGDRRARDVDERGVADVEMLEESARHLVRSRGTARAPVVPLRVEHEVADDELAATVEEVEQGRSSVRTFEAVVLLDFLHRQSTSICGELVAFVREGLLLDEERFPSSQELFGRRDIGKGHASRSSVGCAQVVPLRRRERAELIGRP